MLANRLEGRESLSRDFEFTVEVLSDDARIPLKSVMGKLVTVELVRADGTLRFFNGYVFAFRLLKTDGSVVFYSMTLKPWLAYLKLRKDNYVFHEMSLIEQTTHIFNDYSARLDWDHRLAKYGDVAPMSCQFDEDDHNYLHRRWEAAGWYYWYEHGASGHKLLLADDSSRALAIDGSAPEVRFQSQGGSLEEDGIAQWSPVRQIVPSVGALSAFNFKSPRPGTISMPTLNKQGKVEVVEHYEYAGADGFLVEGGDDAIARRRMEEFEAQGKHFDGEGNCRSLLPGRWFQLTDHFTASNSNRHASPSDSEFLIIEVEHSISNNYLQSTTPAHYSNRFSCIRKKISWRPARGFNSKDTKILAPQSAIVVTPRGQEILTDNYGRVRVQFHWDRIGKNDEKSSAWVRVSSAWAGAESGMTALPRKGQEVIVSWLDGNPDQPIITGRVFNAASMPPWRLGDQYALTGIRSRELPQGGDYSARSNHIVLDDTTGRIQVQIKSDHQHSQLSLGHISRIENNLGRKDFRGEGFALESDGAGALRAAKGLLLSTDGRARAVGGTLSRTELVRCLEQALELAKGLGQAAADHQGETRDSKPQQALTEAVEAMGFGTGDERDAKGAGGPGQPVVAISGEAGIASATPQDQVAYAGKNIDSVAGNNQQHFAGKSILHTAGKDIEQFSVDGDIKSIANKGKIIQQAQQNAIEITADKSVTVMSTKDHILVAAEKHVTLTSGGAYIKLSGGDIEIVCPGNLKFKSASRAFTGPGSMTADMPTFDSGAAGRKFLLHRDGDKLDLLDNHNYQIKLDDGQIIEGKTGADGLTKLAENDAMRIAEIKVWKDKP